MPMYMDIHNVPGATVEDLRKAHEADMDIQHKHGVQCLRYWLNEEAGKAFCLFEAPSAEAANSVHREAHGLVAEKIIEVDGDMAEGFLGGGATDDAGAVRLPAEAGARHDSAIRSVMFTDIVGSTALTQRLGDEGAMHLLRVHDRIVRGALKENGGREVKHTGDGIMAAFHSAASAMRAACAIQERLSQHRQQTPEQPIEVCIGAAVGEPIEEGDDLFGSTVQLAARLCAHASPGQIVVSSAIADLCLGKGLKFTDLGEAAFKGFPNPIRIQAIAN